MVSLQCTVTERGGVSLVECRVANDAAVARRVRIASRLDGPVWPPRREGVPEAGWDDGGYEGTVAAGETVALGFACPAPPADPPVEVAWTERSAAGSGPRPDRHIDVGENGLAADGADPDETTPEDVLRALGDPRPPADAVPLPDHDGGDDRPDTDDPGGTDDDGADEPRSADSEPDDSAHRVPGHGRYPPDDGPDHGSNGVPAAVEAWLDDAAGRVERGEALADADGLTDAARGLEAAGGLDGAAVLVEAVAEDARRLRRVADQAGALAGRAEAAADAPVATLRRLA